MTQAAQGKDFNLDYLLHPAGAFRTPLEIVHDPDMTVQEKRAILASWASDACAVEAAPDLRLEPEDALDDIVPGPLGATRRRASLCDGKPARPGGPLLCHHQGRDGFSAQARRDGPGESEQVAPVAVGRKQGCHGLPVPALKGRLELREPLLYQVLLGPGNSLLYNPLICGVHQLGLI